MDAQVAVVRPVRPTFDHSPSWKCRVCFSAGREALISPCPCRGTSAFVHFSCMTKFHETQGQWSKLEWPTCGHKYEQSVAQELGEYAVRRIEEIYGRDHVEVSGTLSERGTSSSAHWG